MSLLDLFNAVASPISDASTPLGLGSTSIDTDVLQDTRRFLDSRDVPLIARTLKAYEDLIALYQSIYWNFEDGV